jgi:two-component system chemotaxis response regulator CheY
MSDTLLIVDDSEIVRSTMRIFLEQNGYGVLEADSGHAALQILGEETPAVIITDLNMPGMGGLEFVTRVRKDTHFAKTPVFVLTTERSSEMLAKGKAAGATAWLRKPFQPKQLLAGLKKVCGRE